MVARLLVVSYLSLFFVVDGLARITGNGLLRACFIVPPALYVLWRLSLWAAYHARHGRHGAAPVYFGTVPVLVLLYAVAYSALYFPRATSGINAASGVGVVVVHAVFWHLVFHAPVYRGARRKVFFNDMLLGVFAATIVGAAGALSFVGWSFTPGSVHDLAGKAPFVRSDLDVPLLAQVLGTWGAAVLFVRRERRRQAPSSEAGLPSRMLGIVLIGWCVALLVLYSRRTPLFAVLATAALVFAPTRVVRRLAYGAVLIPMVPLFWDRVVAVALPLTQNSVVNAVLARNDASDYLTANSRLDLWTRSIRFLTRPDPHHLIGYGGAPRELHASWSDHMHNAYIQLALDAGLILLLAVIVLLVVSFRSLAATISSGEGAYHAHAVRAVLIGWVVVSGVEPSLRSYSIAHLLFFMFVLAAVNLASSARRLRSTRMAGRTPPTVWRQRAVTRPDPRSAVPVGT